MIRALALLVTLVLQVIAAHLLGFGVAYGLAIGNGWELVAIPLGNTAGIWLVGLAGSWVIERRRPRAAGRRLLATLIGSGAGAAVLAVPGVVLGFGGLLLPLLGGLVGFHAVGVITGERRAG